MVFVTTEDGTEHRLFDSFLAEIPFTTSDFIGLTVEEALALKGRRDRQYLQDGSIPARIRVRGRTIRGWLSMQGQEDLYLNFQPVRATSPWPEGLCLGGGTRPEGCVPPPICTVYW